MTTSTLQLAAGAIYGTFLSTVSVLTSACIAHLFTEVECNKNKKLMEMMGLKDHLKSMGILMNIHVVLLKESNQLNTKQVVSANLIVLGLFVFFWTPIVR